MDLGRGSRPETFWNNILEDVVEDAEIAKTRRDKSKKTFEDMVEEMVEDMDIAKNS